MGCGCLPAAPHLLFPQFMDDSDPEQRALAMKFYRLLPENRESMDLYSRRSYPDTQDSPVQPRGSIRRSQVCNAEIRAEFHWNLSL